MLTTHVNPHDRHAPLKRSLERDREGAWEAANYEREQRDLYTSKLRFGSVVFNGASLVTVLNGGKALFAAADPAVILSSAGFFVIGVVLAGCSLIAHQTKLIETAGASRARAMTLHSAVMLADFPIGSDENDQLGKAMEQAAAYQRQSFSPGLSAIALQNFSMGAWLGGVLCIAAQQIWSFVPQWPWF